jgi:uncharacterized phage protein gp47/JayE
MADIPTPRSYNQILSDLISAFLSRYGISQLQVGSPILSFLEAAAQSDVRSSQDVFNLLDSISIDRANGQALDRLAADENIARRTVTASNGAVTFYDTSFTKKSSLLYLGTGALVAGSLTVQVEDALSFPVSGTIYIGRGTDNFEGPLTYTAKTQFAGYWQLTLSVATSKFHNLGETVVVGQGGLRQIPPGTVVQTTQQALGDAIKFTTIYSAVIPDGEVEVTDVDVLAQTPGLSGNVPANSIKEVVSTLFVGAAVKNPLPFSTATAAETDEALRERIKDAKQSRTKGTGLSIINAIRGARSSEDNKTLISSSLVTSGDRAKLYIDDGTGYEETFGNVATETLMDSALGGEDVFQLSGPRPIAKAFVKSGYTAPFELNDQDLLSVQVGGVTSTHIFPSGDFYNIANASAYEIVASINGNPNLLFNARTSDGGSKVSLFAKSDVNEDLQVLSLDSSDANVALNFSTNPAYTLRLYKNDVLLYKDGKTALVSSLYQYEWNSGITDGDTLILSVDGTSDQTITIRNSDFISQNTGYTTVNYQNSLDSWVTVLSSKIAGVSIYNRNGRLEVSSNLKGNSRSRIEIVGGTLTTKNMFNVGDVSVGQNNDYSLNRNTGQIKLNQPLVEFDKLEIASPNTKAYIQTPEFPTSSVTFAGSIPTWWFCIDGSSSLLNPNISSSTSIAVSIPVAGLSKYQVASGLLGGEVEVGDWVVIWDTAFNASNRGIFRVTQVDNATDYFIVENAAAVPETVTPSSQGIAFARSSTQPQSVSATIATYSLNSLATLFNQSLIGAKAEVYRNKFFRVTSNSFDNGDVLLITANTSAQSLLLPVSHDDAEPNHLATVESGHSELGTPRFLFTSVSSATSNTVTATPKTTSITDSLYDYWGVGDFIKFQKKLDTTVSFYGNASEDRRVLTDITGSVSTTKTNAMSRTPEAGDIVQGFNTFTLGATDSINVILDGDALNKNYNIPLYRQVKPLAGATYGAAAFEVRETAGSSLFAAWGTTSSLFNDFAVYMKARGKSHSISANQALLWRFARSGPEGEWAKVRYVNPTAPSQTLGISASDAIPLVKNQIAGTGTSSYPKTFIDVTLPSGTERTGLGLDGNMYWLFNKFPTFTAGVARVARSAGTTVTVTLDLTLTSYLHNLSIGDIIVLTNSDTDFAAGVYTITNVGAASFQYSDTGANTVNGTSLTYALYYKDAGISYSITNIAVTSNVVTATIGAHPFKIGDVIWVPYPYYYNSGASAVGLGSFTVTAISGTTVSWTQFKPDLASTPTPGVWVVSTGATAKCTAQYYRAQVKAGSLQRVGSVVTATWAATSLVDSCPYAVGDLVYLTPGEANFAAGAKVVTEVGSGYFKYSETGAAVSSAGIQYFQSTPNMPNLTGGGTPVINGDIVNFSSFVPDSLGLRGSVKLSEISSTGFTFWSDLRNTSAYQEIFKLNSLTNMRFFPITPTTASAIATYVNSNSSIVSATVLGTGATNVDTATEDEFLTKTNNASINGAGTFSIPCFDLFDGINYVLNTNISNIASNISLKKAVSGELTTNNDFNNEVLTLIPKTADNFVNFLSNPAATGLSANASIYTSSNGTKVELVSSQSGSEGSIQVGGGQGNQSSALIYNGAMNLSYNNSGFVFNALTSQLSGFSGRMPVRIANQNKTAKSAYINAANTWTIYPGDNANEWLIVSDDVVIVPKAQNVDATPRNWQVMKHGDFVSYTETSASPLDFSGVYVGDLFIIKNPVTGTAFSQVNTGTFIVVAVDATASKNTVWVYNPSGVSEVVTATTAWMRILDYNSIDLGDTLTISSSVLGSANIGSFTVSRRAEDYLSADFNKKFYVTGNMTAATAVLGNDYIHVNIIEANPFYTYTIINSIIEDSEIPGTSKVYCATSLDYSYIPKLNSSVNSTMMALDKLSFPTSVNIGLDGYSYNNGLLGEVHRIVYGDENDPGTYPGVAATPALIDISGPLVKRLYISLEVRLRTGVSIDAILNKIKSAIAAEINNSPIGTNIAISDIVSAANKISGVLSVTIIYPEYSLGNDLIPVQANEKATILDLNNDISVTILN